MSCPRYKDYEPSGSDWMGDIPSNWDARLARRLFKQIREAALEGDEQLSATQRYGVVPQRLFMELEDQKVMLALAGLGNFKHVEQDDFVISLRSFQGGIEHSAYSGCVSPAYTVLRARNAISPSYFAYTLKCSLFVSALQTATDGIRDGKNISYDQFGGILLPLPPLPEQAAVSAFLDRETCKIDALADEQKRLIELLKEKRQAVISHAVNKGLSPGAPMKDTGIEWLGEVPEHWEVRPLKYLVKLESGGTPSKNNESYWGGEIPWASAKDLKTDRLSTTVQGITPLAIDDGAASTVAAGSVLVLVRGMMLARTFPVVVSSCPMAINQDLKALNGTGIRNEYLAWALRGTEAETLSRVDEAGHGTKALRMDAWTSMEIPVPPEEEQLRIARSLEEDTAAIDQLIVEVEAAISLLQERRAALICAAVTGKIDVRGHSISPVATPDFRHSRKLVAAKIVEDLAGQKTFGRVKLQKLLYLAEAHSGIHELSGNYVREAAGPLDRDMVREVETALQVSGHVVIEQPEGRGTAVNYQLRGTRGALETELQTLLGDRISALSELIETVGALDTRGAEAVATLYAVWNDTLASGTVPSDDEIIREVLTEWHPKKAETFTVADLEHWLAWMRRNGLKPKGNSPVTSTGRLFV